MSDRGECPRCDQESTLVPLTFGDQPVNLGGTSLGPLTLCVWCCEAMQSAWDSGTPTRPIDVKEVSDE